MSRRRSKSRGWLLPPPPAWDNPPLVLYHGTAEVHVPSVLQGIVVPAGRRRADFGPGFYTTTRLAQARAWASDTASRLSRRSVPAQPAVIQLTVDRDALAGLDALHFVRGDADADDFWSFVRHCRTTGGDHGRPVNAGWYDVVYGPLAVAWELRTVVPDAAQIGFHTARAAAVLNRSQPREVV